jgi:hypothetical protein
MAQARRSRPDVDIADRNVRLSAQDPQLARRFQFELDFGMSGGEPVETVYQPPRREGGLDGDPQPLRRNSAHCFHGALDPQKSGGQLGRELLARLRQLYRPMKASKQLPPDVFFETADVTTYRGLRYVQLSRSFGETQSPRRRLEGS